MQAQWMASLTLGGLCIAGCGPAASEGGFDSANSAARLYAIQYAAQHDDRSAIPRLVEQLDADDPAVRCLAIGSLRRLTGQTKGYRDFDPPELRREALQRWVEAVQAGEFETSAAAPWQRPVPATEGFSG